MPATTNTISEIITNENNRLDAKKSQVDSNLDTQTRLMLLHESHRKRTTHYTAIMAYIVFGVLAYLGLEYLSSVFLVIPGVIFTVLKVLVIVLTAYYVIATYTDAAMRSTGNFDEIDVPPMIDLSGNTVGVHLMETEVTPSNAGNFGTLFGNACVGETCCSTGTIWDPTSKTCIVSAPSSGFTTIADGQDVQGVYLTSIKSNLDGVLGSYTSSGEKYVLPEFVNVNIGQIA